MKLTQTAEKFQRRAMINRDLNQQVKQIKLQL